MSVAPSADRDPRSKSTTSARREVPRVPGALPLVGHTIAFARDPDAFIAACTRRHGTVFGVKLLAGPRTFLLDPFDYPKIFAEERLRFQESGAEIGGRVFGYPKETALGEPAHAISHVTGRDMRGDALQVISEQMQALFVARMARAIGRGTIERPLLELLSDEFFAAGIDAIFGEGFATKALYEDYALLDRFFGAAVAGVPAWALPGFVRARDGLARAMLRRGPKYASVLDGRDEVYRTHALDRPLTARFDVGLLWASQANTVMTAFWTLVYLLRHPEALARVQDEVRTVTGATTLARAEPITRDAMRRLVLLDSACSEGMRLTAGPMNGRFATTDFTFPLDAGGALDIKAGDEFLLYPRHTHFDAEIFADPTAFRFDRFVDDRGRSTTFTKGGRRLTMPYLPFGGGVSMCPGRFFARNEIKVLVATMLTWLDTELITRALPPLDFSRIGLGTLPPKHDVTIRIRAR